MRLAKCRRLLVLKELFSRATFQKVIDNCERAEVVYPVCKAGKMRLYILDHYSCFNCGQTEKCDAPLAVELCHLSGGKSDERYISTQTKLHS